MPADRLLVIDADLHPRIAGELRKRGRAARSLQDLSWKNLEDPEMLEEVFHTYPDAVLVTGDDSLPQDHADKVRDVGATLATIEPHDFHIGAVHSVDETSEEEAYEREIIHRWVQVMQDQPRRSIRRYFLTGGRQWRPRR